MIEKVLPVYCYGSVIKGFGRGSKQLGIPTANYPDDVVTNASKDLSTGVYLGWAQVDSGEVYKMVMSVGWNPYYKNIKKSMETHIMHNFHSDFYGSTLKTCILYYIRAERDFSSLDDLIATIKSDIKLAEEKLELPEYLKYKTHPFFTTQQTTGEINRGEH